MNKLLLKHFFMQILILSFFVFSSEYIKLIHFMMNLFGVSYKDTHMNLGVIVYGALVIFLPIFYWFYIELIDRKKIIVYVNFWFVRAEIFLLLIIGVFRLFM